MKLIDFGLSQKIKKEETEDTVYKYCGTYGYMAPEINDFIYYDVRKAD